MVATGSLAQVGTPRHCFSLLWTPGFFDQSRTGMVDQNSSVDTAMIASDPDRMRASRAPEAGSSRVKK
jgi:hypothetical protein